MKQDHPHSQSNSLQNIQSASQSFDYGDLQYTSLHGFFSLNQTLTPQSAPTPFLSGFPQSQPDLAFSTAPREVYDNNFPLTDLSTVMFPSPDPLAYPNQASATDQLYESMLRDLGNDASFPFPAQLEALRNQPINGSSPGFVPLSFTFMFNGTNSGEQNINPETDVQLLGPMPMYLIQGSSSFQNESTRLSMNYASGSAPEATYTGQSEYSTPRK